MRSLLDRVRQVSVIAAVVLKARQIFLNEKTYLRDDMYVDLRARKVLKEKVYSKLYMISGSESLLYL